MDSKLVYLGGQAERDPEYIFAWIN